MKIEKVKFHESEINEIYETLINLFNSQTANYREGDSIQFELCFDELNINVESNLKLYDDIYEEGDNIKSPYLTRLMSRQVIEFSLTIFIQGDEIESNINLEERIKQFYEK